jgi:predicted SAM-dependent methyltransferase
MLLKQLEIKIAWRLRRGNAFKRKLIAEGKTRWLDLGCGNNFQEGFEYMDWIPHENLPDDIAKRYHRVNVVDLTDDDIASVGTFDLIRMQHVFEHFSPEDGVTVLKSCAKLLNYGGYLLMTTPDLRINIKSYLNGTYQRERFGDFAEKRIPKGAPSSFYFSVFAHSFAHAPLDESQRSIRDQHKWCYDFEGLKYQLERAGEFKNIKNLRLTDPLAHIPFTHNRPEEEVCVLAQRA